MKGRGDMQGIESADRLVGKRLSRAGYDLRRKR